MFSGDRTIVHCDCNGFYASVACVKNPELKHVPMAVCGNPEHRHGIILAKNELAKQYGIVTAETVWQAKQKCPDLVLVPPEHEEYRRFSQMVNQIYLRYTDMVEPFSIDESWLDLTGSRMLFGDGITIANELRRQVREELGITISAGVSFNKIFAKLGSDYQKPDATTVITRENYMDILFPLPVSRMIYVGQSTEKALLRMGIHTIGELARSNPDRLSQSLGKLGHSLWEYANGLDQSPVRRFDETREIKSVGNGITFRRNLEGWEDIQTGALALCDTVASRLRKYGLKCFGIQVTIKDPDFRVISRQKPLAHATDLSRDLLDGAMELIRASWAPARPIRMLTITAIRLTDHDPGLQTSLFAPEEQLQQDKLSRLETTMDQIRNRFGKNAVQSGRILRNDLGLNGSQPQGSESEES
ncbi:MAG: DNA polymerase IV [Massiliimalia sp.]|jgi:DNA polymerase-4